MVGNDLAPTFGGQVTPPIVLTKDEQRRYEKFGTMDPPKFQAGKSEDAHEFLTICRELLEVVGLGESHRVQYDKSSFLGQRESGGEFIRALSSWISSTDLGDII
ncbi:hypothetical protein KY290_027518 [Solanum tuberosum]|uniref:Uncharacterized protein n=1 Tax=Solanum tuberosum TaxID=4113 RepID=A0ABQ7UF85_SOLTU|nr:hypothetical protein KY285_026454 [Solanum tuberosum]KAH0748286.1 hypothetical protein KY290_027518 [Solanum tuberosum]